jgi:Ca2+-binding RTX toxin-like protein
MFDFGVQLAAIKDPEAAAAFNRQIEEGILLPARYDHNSNEMEALADQYIAGFSGGQFAEIAWEPNVPPTGSGPPVTGEDPDQTETLPEESDCHLTGTALLAARDHYENLNNLNQTLNAHASSENIQLIKASLSNLKEVLFLNDVVNFSMSAYQLLNNAADMLAIAVPKSTGSGYSSYAKLRDSTEVALKLELAGVNKEGKIALDVDDQVDMLQLPFTLFSESKLVGATMALTDLAQAANGLAENVDRHFEWAGRVQAAEAALDVALKYNRDRPEIEQTLRNAYDASNQLFQKYYGDCVTTVSFESGQLITLSGRIPHSRVLDFPDEEGLVFTANEIVFSDAEGTVVTLPEITQPDPGPPIFTEENFSTGGAPCLGLYELKAPALDNSWIRIGSCWTDFISTTENSNFVLAGDGNDRVVMNSDYNVVFGGAGDDVIDFDSDNIGNIVGFQGNRADYAVDLDGTVITVTDGVSERDGTDIIHGTAGLRFADGLSLVGKEGLAPLEESLSLVHAISAAAQDRPMISTTKDGVVQSVPATFYAGPVASLQWQFLGSSSGEAVAGSNGADFINLLGGDDAASGGEGDDVLDGGTGSNFLTGGTGRDVFFLDGRGGQTTWATITDWTAGEQLSLWGWRPGVSVSTWIASDGTAGFKGATMHTDLDGNGMIDASVTWANISQAELQAPSQHDGLLWFS